MKKKILTIALVMVSGMIFMPEGTFAATPAEMPASYTSNNAEPQIRVRVGNRNRRGRGWNRGRGHHRGWERRNRTRLVRQVYYVNGRRYVRTVRVRY